MSIENMTEGIDQAFSLILNLLRPRLQALYFAD